MTEQSFTYDRDDHSAAWTSDYVFNQLIPYIGNKRKLLGLIQLAIAKTEVKPSSTFLDVFAGSGVVSRMAKKMFFRVITNDWEPYAKEINNCYIFCNKAPDFADLGGYHSTLQMLNDLPPIEDWITKHLCPSNDDQYDIQKDRMFYTRSNGMKLDAMRLQIKQWEDSGHITSIEKSCLLAPMIYQACYTSNTSGVFKGFHNGWGGQTQTALYRILSNLQLKPTVFFDNNKENIVEKMDCIDLANKLLQDKQAIDIAYLDPPYNQHPYGSNYHVLNTLTLWDYPILSEKIEGRNKAAIRHDWRTERRSAYNYRGEAEKAFEKLINLLPARYILTSYSTDGMISLNNMVDICIRKGHTELVLQSYKRYRVSSQRFSYKPINVEFILIVDTHRKHSGLSVEEICEHIIHAEEIGLDIHPESTPKQLDQLTFFWRGC